MDTSLENFRSDNGCEITKLLQAAFEQRATDIHLEPYEGGGRIRFRVDRFFRVVSTTDRAVMERLIGRIRVLAHLPSYESFRPQEGRIDPEEIGIQADVRVSIIPCIGGQKAVLRLLSLSASVSILADLGFAEDTLNALLGVSRFNSGLVLVCGPSGSGKTTTLYSLVQHLMQLRGNEWQFVSVEDPVERRIAGMTQIEVKPHFDLSFPSALKYLLRQDPEVILVGEIRDSETAAVAVQAAFTGHLVLSTMHTGFAAEAILRLVRMGIPEYQILSSVNLVITQRLLRRKCDACKHGCTVCLFSGYAGLVPVGECSYPEDLLPSGPFHRERAAGPLRAQAEILVRSGLTTHEEVNRIFE